MPSAIELIRKRRQFRGKPNYRMILAQLSIWLLSSLGLGFLVLVFVTGIYFTTLIYDLPAVEDVEDFFLPSQGMFPTPVQVFDQLDESVVTILLHPVSSERRWLEVDSVVSPSIPRDFVDAVVASQDETFWSHEGFDTRDFLGGIVDILLGREEDNLYRSIPQRLVYMTMLPGDDFSQPPLSRYLRSAVLAQNLVESYSKEQILEWYLNSVRFGGLTQGIDAASLVYFGKGAREISLGECVVLAALLDQPGLDPLGEFGKVKERQGSILARMVNLGWITKAEFESALEEPIDFTEPQPFGDMGLAKFTELEMLTAIGPIMFQRLGLRIHSTIDLDLQTQMICTADIHLDRMSGLRISQGGCDAAAYLPPLRPGDLGVDHFINDAAMVSIDPWRGEIQAIYGDVGSKRSPGRMAYPLLYLTAFSLGFAPGDMILDLPTTAPSTGSQGGEPSNGVGPIRMRNALVGSYSYAADRVHELVGNDALTGLMNQLGISPGPESLSGGSVGFDDVLKASVLDLGYAYTAFATLGSMTGLEPPIDDQGSNLSPILVLKITDVAGVELYTPSSNKQSVLSPPLAYLIVDVLSDSSARWSILGRPNVFDVEYPIGVMTEGKRDLSYESWTIGFSPSLVQATWVGNSDDRELYRVNSENAAASLWLALTEYTAASDEIEGWSRPPGLLDLDVCDPSGLLPTEHCPALVQELYLEGTEPFQFDTLYVPFKVNRESGRLATMATPVDLIEERVFFTPPPEAADWAEQQGFERPPSEYDLIVIEERENAGASIEFPVMFSNVHGSVRIRGRARGASFDFYRVQYGAGLNPSQWVVIGENQNQPQDRGLLAVWETEGLDGLYTIQLLVIDGDGRIESDFVHVTVDNQIPFVILDALPDRLSSSEDEPVTLHLVAQVEDNLKVEKVEFVVDDLVVGVDESVPYFDEITFRGPGVYEVFVKAYDFAGNVGESEVQVVRVVE